MPIDWQAKDASSRVCSLQAATICHHQIGSMHANAEAGFSPVGSIVLYCMYAYLSANMQP
jgi:hypothetical protein